MRAIRCGIVLTVCLAGLLTQSVAQKPYRGAEYRTIGTMTYGRFEVRMRSANVSGMLASFFTYYDPASPWNEIDIENMGRYTNEVQYNTIVPTQADNHVQRQIVPFNPHTGFHVYAIEWTPAYVAWRIDGDEVYRQTGPHIDLLTKAQKLMMNVWQPSSVDWAGSFAASSLPVYSYYDWVKYYRYTPGVNGDFTLDWTDEFATFDATRWQKATHTWDGNNAQFVTANAVLQGGYLILCLTSNTTSGYGGGAIIDQDQDAPYLVDVRAFDSTVVARFSEPVDPVTAQSTASYLAAGLSFSAAQLRADGRTVDLAASGITPGTSPLLLVQGMKDRAVPSNVSGLIYRKIVMGLPLPIAIDVAGAGTATALPDSVWDISRQYGAVGGKVSMLPAATPIANTAEPAIYRSALHGLAGYKVRVPNGTYRVTLQMVEDVHTTSGKRIMSASAEGVPLFSNLDVCLLAGAKTAYTAATSGIVVTDNMLDITMTAAKDSTTLSGLIVERTGGATGVRMRDQVPASPGLEIFPNPTNGSATLHYTLPHEGTVGVVIFDDTGRQVRSFDLGTITPGVHAFRWSTDGMASGTYFCALRSEGVAVTRRLLLVK